MKIWQPFCAGAEHLTQIQERNHFMKAHKNVA